MSAGHPSRNKRAKTFEHVYDGAADDEAHSKGGHSLRKRTRVDYAQVDDLSPAVSRAEFSNKSSSAAPSARYRKRKDSEDDSAFVDEPTASAKRRRADNPSAHGRSTSSAKRRPELEPGQTTLPFTYIEEQQSDNEIRDTIMVGISMEDDNADETDASDMSSPLEQRSRSSTSGGSDTGPARIQPATPQPVEEPVALTSDLEAGELMPLAGEAEIAPIKDLELVPQLNQREPKTETDQVSADEVVKSDETAPKPIVDEQSVGPQLVGESRAQSPEKQNVLVQGTLVEKSEAAPPSAPLKSTEKESSPPTPPTPLLSAEVTRPTSESLNKPAEPPGLLMPAGPGLASESSQSSRAGVSPGVPRKGRLESIYTAPTEFGSKVKLTPYEKDEVLLPGPYLEKPRPVESSMPSPTSTTPSPVDQAPPEFIWDPRRWLKQGEFFRLYRQEMRKRELAGEARMSMADFNRVCARKHKAAIASMDEADELPAVALKRVKGPAPATTAPAHMRRQALAATASFDETPLGSQAAESRQPTAAPSPAAGDEAEPAVDISGTLLFFSGVDVQPVERVHIPKKQYSFPKIRDPSEFIEALENWQELDKETLYKTTAAAAEALRVWQLEANELRKIIDDEDNAKRRQPNDKAIENWENRKRPDEPEHWRRHFDESNKGPPPFEVKGVRAPKPYIDDPVLERQKENDRIQAQAYGFKYDPHPARVGRQNPEEQRWDSGERGLRDRKKTEKGAELAEENVIEGKRTRKPRNVSDQSKEPSRSATPIGAAALSLGRRPKRKLAATTIQEDENKSTKPAVDENSAPVSKKRRGPRARVEPPAEEVQDEPLATIQDNKKTDADMAQGRSTATRKRGPAPTSAPAEKAEPKITEQRPDGPAKTKQSGEIASSSFYSNASNPSPAETPLESRPSTASSEATVHTAASETTYSLREKRKRNFVLENDPELEPRAQKKARAAPLKMSQEAFEPKKRAPRKKKEAVAQPVQPQPQPPAPAPPMIAPQPVGGLKAPAMFFNTSPPVLAPAPGPFIHTFNAAPPALPPNPIPNPIPTPLPVPEIIPIVKKPIRIKLTTNGPGPGSQGSSRTSTPANIAPNPTTKSGKASRGSSKPPTPSDVVPPQQLGLANPLNGDQGDQPEKPYAEMSKSEKMSYSMRRRWANGEMKGAVEKRRTTLANKKAEKAASSASNSADPSLAGRTPDPNSAGPSAPNTPALLPTQIGPLAFPPPSQSYQPLQQPMQQPMQQGYQPMPPQGLPPIPHGLQQLHHGMSPVQQPGLQPPQQPHPAHLQQPMQPFQALQQPPHLLQPGLAYSYPPPQGPVS